MSSTAITASNASIVTATRRTTWRTSQVMETHEQSTRAWASGQGLVAAAGLGAGGGLLIVMAGLLAGVLAIWNPGDMSATALVTGRLRRDGLRAAAARRGDTPYEGRTPDVGRARRLSARPVDPVEPAAFRVLRSPRALHDLPPVGRGLRVVDDWAAKYRTETGAEPPVPVYFAGGYSGVHTGNQVDQMINDFDHTVSSAISSYQASQRSSSGGGGGGGFCGGGGGGGGSWRAARGGPRSVTISISPVGPA